MVIGRFFEYRFTTFRMQVAVSMGTPIVTGDWIRRCWEARDQLNARATDEQFMVS